VSFFLLNRLSHTRSGPQILHSYLLTYLLSNCSLLEVVNTLSSYDISEHFQNSGCRPCRISK
jgi:hypothetical protein